MILWQQASEAGAPKGAVRYVASDTYAIRSIRAPAGMRADDLRAYVERNFPSLFPIPFARAKVSILRGAGDACVVVAAAAERLAADGGRPLPLAAGFLVHGSTLSEGYRAVLRPDAIELFRLEAGVPVESKTLASGPDPARALAEALESAPETAGAELEVVADKSYKEVIREALAGRQGPEPRLLGYESLEPPRGRPGAFSALDEEPKTARFAPFLAIAFLGLCSCFALYLVDTAYKGRLAAVSRERKALLAEIRELDTLLARLGKLEAERRGADAETPPAGRVLGALAEACRGEFTFRRVTVENGKFSGEAEGPSAIGVLESLEADPRFVDSAVQGVVTRPGGRETFTVSGRFHD